MRAGTISEMKNLECIGGLPECCFDAPKRFLARLYDKLLSMLNSNFERRVAVEESSLFAPYPTGANSV